MKLQSRRRKGRSALRGSIVLFAFVGAACGGGTAKDKTPSADVIVADVDGGTVVETATPDGRKKKWPSKSEARVLSHTECRAVTMHVVELLARDAKIDPNAMQEATWDPGSFTLCDQPVFSDEIFDCVLAAKSYSEVPPCMKYGNVLKH